MKKIAILRFGPPLPSKIEMEVVQKFAIDKNNAHSAGFGMMGLITCFESEYSAKTISNWIMEWVLENLQPSDPNQKTIGFPFIAFDMESEDASYNLCGFNKDIDQLFGIMGIVKGHSHNQEDNTSDSVDRCTLSFDELLDIVAKGGVKSLNKVQRSRLDELSKLQ